MTEWIDPRWGPEGRPIEHPSRPASHPPRRRPLTDAEAEKRIEEAEWERDHGEPPDDREVW